MIGPDAQNITQMTFQREQRKEVNLMVEPTVLVVDDSPTVRKIVQMTLQR